MPESEVIAVLGSQVQAAAPQSGGRKVLIENVLKLKNNVGEDVIYIQFAYKTSKGTFSWGLTYKAATDVKLAKLFPNGVITTDVIGKVLPVEIGWCMSKNGEYPSILGLDDCEL